MRNTRSRHRKCISGAIALSLLTTSGLVPPAMADFTAHAASRPKPPKFEDDCKPLRQPFSSIKNYQSNQILKGAVTGALVGLLIGALANSQRRERTDQYGNTVREGGNNIGAYVVTGAIGGGLVGYLGSIERNREKQAELQEALAKFDGEREQYGRLPNALAELGNCRNTQVFSVQQQLEAGVIDARETGRRLDLIDQWVAADDKLIAAASKSEHESIRTYAQANAVAEGVSAQEATDNGDTMIARYEDGSTALQGNVELTEDTATAETIRTNLGVAPSATVPQPPPVQEPPVPVTHKFFVASERGANVRAEPSSQGALLGIAPFGAELPATESNVAGWSGVTFQGKSGYVSRTLLTEAAPVKSAPVQVARRAPRPEAAPVRIAYQPVIAGRQQHTVTRAMADGHSIRAVNEARQSSYQQQMATARSRLAQSLGSAQT